MVHVNSVNLTKNHLLREAQREIKKSFSFLMSPLQVQYCSMKYKSIVSYAREGVIFIVAFVALEMVQSFLRGKAMGMEAFDIVLYGIAGLAYALLIWFWDGLIARNRFGE